MVAIKDFFHFLHIVLFPPIPVSKPRIECGRLRRHFFTEQDWDKLRYEVLARDLPESQKGKWMKMWERKWQNKTKCGRK